MTYYESKVVPADTAIPVRSAQRYLNMTQNGAGVCLRYRGKSRLHLECGYILNTTGTTPTITKLAAIIRQHDA
jgi:translation elongation factor EF-Tu-like GTPase